MKADIIRQYEHTWRIFERVAQGFSEEAWIHAGRGTTTPARTALHILQGTKFYIEDSSTTVFASGQPFESDWERVSEDQLPSQDDIVECIHEFKRKSEAWLSTMDFDAENTSFEWAGKTRLGVVLFLLRHSVYHIGELSSLLNESRNGEAEDSWVSTL